MTLHVRELTSDESAKIDKLIHSRTAPVRLIQRAWMIKLSAEGESARAIAKRLDVVEAGPRLWIKRFNAEGLPGLEDAPRSGCPRTYTEEQRSQVIAKARGLPPKPEGSELPPTCHWTLDLLQVELDKDGLPIKRSQIRRILKDEHIKWQKDRTWLESDDPEFAQKRGTSLSFIPSRQLAAR